jgi:hypothetical protein
MSRLKGYWKTILAVGGAAAGYLVTLPIDGLPVSWRPAVTAAVAVVLVLFGPRNKPEPAQPVAAWPVEPSEHSG